MDNKLRTETLCIQAGYQPGNGEPRQLPIIQSTTFKYATSEDMGKLFDLEASGYFYSRLANPTCDAVAAKICALEGGSAAMLTSSGQAASFMAVFNIAGCGDHIVASSAIYGGTFNLISVTMKRMGIEATFVNRYAPEPEDPGMPQTDDDIGLWLALMLISGGAVLCTAMLYRKYANSDE